MLLLRSARQPARASLDFGDTAPDCLSAKGEGVSSRSGLASSCSYSGGPVVYSRGPLAPQVAPLVTGLQDRLLRLMAGNITGVFNRHEDLPCLKVEALVAHGGFGSVFKGLWQGLEVAIKVIPQRMDQTDSVREAVELAVMSTVSHPNILGVQNYWTDVLVSSASSACRSLNGLLCLESGLHPAAEEVVEVVGIAGAVAGSAAPGAAAAGAKSSHIQRMSVSAPDVKRSLVIVMELCDQGSLDEAIHSGAFRLTLPGKAPRINMLAVLTTLLEVAMALRHMHAMQLVHCDLKPGNVLLKSSLSDVRHFTTKLCDFGLVKFRQEALDLTEQIRRATFTGTVTHSPPEMLRGDPNPQFAYDTYAFGILMWEMVSWTPVYAGLSDRQVAQQVVYNSLRPEFPRGMDPQYRDLAQRCWAPDPGQRPTMAEVVLSLSHMLMGLRARAAAAANSVVLHGLTPASSTQRGAAGQLHAGGKPQRPSHHASHPH
ncbi:kinase-like domain-containing protein [Haematococcus lacustris]